MTAPQTPPPPTPWDVVARQVLAMREQLEAVLLYVEAQRAEAPRTAAASQPAPGMADLLSRLSRRDGPQMPATFGRHPEPHPEPHPAPPSTPEPTPNTPNRSPDDGPQKE